MFFKKKSKNQNFFGREGKGKENHLVSSSLSSLSPPPHTPVFFEPPVPPTIQAHGTSPPTQGRREGEGFLGGFCAKQRWRAGSLLSPARSHRHLPPPQAGGSHPRATGGVGCECGVGMPPLTKTTSFLESTKVFNFFFFLPSFFLFFS